MFFGTCQAQVRVLHSPLVQGLGEAGEALQHRPRGDGTLVTRPEESLNTISQIDRCSFIRAQTTVRHIGLKRQN